MDLPTWNPSERKKYMDYMKKLSSFYPWMGCHDMALRHVS